MRYLSIILSLLFLPTIALAQLGQNAIKTWDTPTSNQNFSTNTVIEVAGQVEIPANWLGTVRVFRNGVRMSTYFAAKNYGNSDSVLLHYSIPLGKWSPGTYTIYLQFDGADHCVIVGTCSASESNKSFFQRYADRKITIGAPVTKGLLDITPFPSLYFTSAQWGAPKETKSVVVRNDGGTRLQGKVTLPTGTPFACTNGCTYDLYPGDSEKVYFTFTPPKTGVGNLTEDANFSCTSTAGCVDSSIDLALKVYVYDPKTPPPSAYPDIVVEPSSLFDFDIDEFGDPVTTDTGSTRTEQITFKNVGGATAYGYNPRFITNGGVSNDFILPKMDWDEVEPGKSVTYTLTFSPSNGGLLQATARFTFTNGNKVDPWSEKPQIDLRGTGKFVAILDFRGSDTDFGNVPIGAYIDHPITVKNLGTKVLGSGTFQFSSGSPFSCVSPVDKTDGKCHYDIGPDGEATIIVRFKPTSGLGLASDNMTLSGYPTYPLQLTGTVVAASPDPIASIVAGNNIISRSQDPMTKEYTIDFGAVPVGTDRIGRIFVANTGGQPLAITSYTQLLQPNFSNSVPMFPVSVSSPGSHPIDITFHPTSGGPQPSRTITVQSDDTANFVGGVIRIHLVGSGLTAPNLVVDPPNWGFADEDVFAGTQSKVFTVTNMGTDDVDVSLSVNKNPGTNVGEFTVSPVSLSIPADGSPHMFTVVFNPDTLGSRGASIILKDKDPASSYQKAVPVWGSGVIEPTIEPQNIDFGKVPVTKCKDLIVTISNNDPRDFGMVDLSLLDPSFTCASPSPQCRILLGPGADRDVTLRFCPIALGAQSTSLLFSNGLNGIDGFTITPVTGEGVRTTIKYVEQ